MNTLSKLQEIAKEEAEKFVIKEGQDEFIAKKFTRRGILAGESLTFVTKHELFSLIDTTVAQVYQSALDDFTHKITDLYGEGAATDIGLVVRESLSTEKGKI